MESKTLQKSQYNTQSYGGLEMTLSWAHNLPLNMVLWSKEPMISFLLFPYVLKSKMYPVCGKI